LPGGAKSPLSAPRSSVPPPLGGEPERRLGSLAVACEGTKVMINKPRFVIGRGKQSTDLTIKDPNVSRQHAMVEFVNGRHYIVDMGSTNGILLDGARVERRLINDGDMFQICDHTLVFMFD
jgi:pSer/pThr/pTyr-binding forkhead associated (FHA) protein